MKVFSHLSALLLLFCTLSSCEPDYSYEAELRVMDFVTGMPAEGAVVVSGIIEENELKDILPGIIQTQVADENGIVFFDFPTEANLAFEITFEDGEKTGRTNVKLIPDDKVAKVVFVYPVD